MVTECPDITLPEGSFACCKPPLREITEPKFFTGYVVIKGKLSREEFDRFRKEFDELNNGAPNPVIPSGWDAEFVKTKSSPREGAQNGNTC